MIPTLRFFELYTAIMLHFKEGSSYDFFKYGGKTRVNETSLNKRKDRYSFEKLARKVSNEEEAIGLIVANMIKGKSYIRDIDYKNYTDWVAYRDGLAYRFSEDLDKYAGNNSAIIECQRGSIEPYPYLIIQNELTNGFLFDYYNKKYKNDILWEELYRKLSTYKPFVIHYWHVDEDAIQSLKTKNQQFLATK